MNEFKGRHFRGEIVLWAVRWHCRYAISDRALKRVMTERGVAVDHSTIYRWVQRFASHPTGVRVQDAEDGRRQDQGF